MSSEFLDWLECDENKAIVGLNMNANGYAWLYNYQSAAYALPPNEKGWKAAEMIANALLEWVKHTKRIQQNEGK